MKDDGRLISRYYNNLYLLDRMISGIHDHLLEQDLLERTILVVIGDHGKPSVSTILIILCTTDIAYNENLETPASSISQVFFKPRRSGFPTSPVDHIAYPSLTL